MANFESTYNNYILPNEGGYSNHPNDRGAETYGGITRKFNPDWEGWTFIDFYKRTRGFPAHNQKFPELTELVKEFYGEKWDGQRFDEIKNQQLADLLFDYYVHSGSHAIKAVQKIQGVTSDGIIGPVTLKAINSANPSQLYTALLNERKSYLKNIVTEDASQTVFLAGWMNRLDNFLPPGKYVAVVIVLVFLAVLAFVKK